MSSETVEDRIAAIEELSLFYIKIANSENYFFPEDNDILTNGGIALSSLHASDCIDDHLRTALLLKGVYKAITQFLDKHPDRTMKIVYAGCGPYATLLLPVLPLLNKDRVEAIILDINKESIESVKRFITLFDLEGYRLDFVVADATTYTKPDTVDIDMVISETMHYALTSEPQVAIMQNLIPQMRPEAIFIPQAIHIYMGYSFFAKEPFLTSTSRAGQTITEPYPYRNQIDRLFSVNKELILNYLRNGKQIETRFYSIPDTIENCPDICLFTELTIFDDITLKTAESYITNPYCIASLYNLKGSSEFQLTYDFSGLPKWSINLKNRQ